MNNIHSNHLRPSVQGRIAPEALPRKTCLAERLLVFRAALGFAALGFGKDDLAQPQMMGSYLDVFIFLDIFQGFFKGKFHGRGYLGLVVRSGCAHVGQFLFLGYIDHDIAAAGILPNDLTFVHVLARIDEKRAAILQFVQGVRNGFPWSIEMSEPF